MFKKFESTILFIMKLLLFCACAGVFFLIFGSKFYFMLIPTRTSFITLGVFTLVYMMMSIIYGGFDIGKRKSKPIIYSFVLSVFFTDIHRYNCAFFHVHNEYNGNSSRQIRLRLSAASASDVYNTDIYYRCFYLRRKLSLFFGK